MKRVLIILVLFGALRPHSLYAKDKVEKCEKHTQVGDECIIDVDKLHPTQFAVGMEEVLCRKEKLEKKDRHNKLEEYLAEKPAPIVRGLNNAFYLTDHHHLAVALANAHVKDSKKEMHAILKADFSDSKSSGEFWRRMQDHGFVWLKDNNGQVRSPDEIPNQVRSMSDDPMRTLSAWVGDSCGYVKCDDEHCRPMSDNEKICGKPLFLEFRWADYLRQVEGVRDRVGNDTDCTQRDLETLTCLKAQHSKLAKAFPPAMQAVANAKAKDDVGQASGYNPNAPQPSSPPPDCLDSTGAEND
jgi:hypothetical protein